MRVLSLKDVQLTDAYAGLSAPEKAALASRWTAVPAHGALSTGLLRSWLIGQGVQVAAWPGNSAAASVGARSMWRSPAVAATRPAQSSGGEDLERHAGRRDRRQGP